MNMITLNESLFKGYISEVEDGVWISAIESKNIGNGDFSKLIKEKLDLYVDNED